MYSCTLNRPLANSQKLFRTRPAYGENCLQRNVVIVQPLVSISTLVPAAQRQKNHRAASAHHIHSPLPRERVATASMATSTPDDRESGHAPRATASITAVVCTTCVAPNVVAEATCSSRFTTAIISFLKLGYVHEHQANWPPPITYSVASASRRFLQAATTHASGSVSAACSKASSREQ